MAKAVCEYLLHLTTFCFAFQATQYSLDKQRVHDKLGEAFAVQVCIVCTKSVRVIKISFDFNELALTSSRSRFVYPQVSLFSILLVDEFLILQINKAFIPLGALLMGK